jgi:hypothetical protein
MNKFSVRYYIKCTVTELKNAEDDHNSSPAQSHSGESDLTSTSYEVTFWRWLFANRLLIIYLLVLTFIIKFQILIKMASKNTLD